MKDHIRQRVIDTANYIMDTKCTIREAAKHFKVGKSTTHKDMTLYLPQVNSKLAYQVHNILDINFDDRQKRGGAATRKRYSVLAGTR